MKLCVALDMPSKEECLNFAKSAAGLDIWLKIGMRAFYRDGADFLKELKNIGNFKLFVDLKLYDIPNTMCDAACELAKIGADMINLHASAGVAAMNAVSKRLKSEFGDKRPLILAVTALTSFDEENFCDIYSTNIENFVKKMSKESKENGIDGVVCSAYESRMIKELCGDDFITLCPGIRPVIGGHFTDKNDQARVAGIGYAKEQKADFIVVGRPIYQASDPKIALREVLEQL